MIRDFSDAAKEHLIEQVKRVTPEGFLEKAGDFLGDAYLSFRSKYGSLNIEHYVNDVDTYHEKILDCNDTTVGEIEQIFLAVHNVDNATSAAVIPLADAFQEQRSKISRLCETLDIPTRRFVPSTIQAIQSGEKDPKDFRYLVSRDQLKEFGWVDMTDEQFEDLNRALEKFGINTPERIRHFMSQCAHESANGRYTREIASGEAYNGRGDLGNVYPGDGPKYKGGGYIQLTGRSNYQSFSDYMGDPEIMNQGCSYVADNYPWSSAAYWWYSHGMNEYVDGLSGLSDSEAVSRVTRRVNGGYNGLSDRQNKYQRAKSVF